MAYVHVKVGKVDHREALHKHDQQAAQAADVQRDWEEVAQSGRKTKSTFSIIDVCAMKQIGDVLPVTMRVFIMLYGFEWLGRAGP